MIAHINIGSNRGDSLALIGQAVAAIASAFPEHRTKVSQPFESEPWGFESPHNFINIGIALAGPDVDPVGLLHKLLEIEKGISPATHRNSDGTYRDRELDIDLVAVDSIVMDTPELILPHPRMHLRSFVLSPIAELDPAWRHPILKKSAEELLSVL